MANKKIILTFLIVPLVCYGWQREVLDWGLIGGMAAGGAVSSVSKPFFSKPLWPSQGNLEYKGETVSSLWGWVAELGVAGITSLAPNHEGWLNSRSYRHLKGALGAASASYFTSEFLKIVVGKPRPDYEDRIRLGIEVADARKSWPSGHATHFFTALTYLTLFTWDEWRSDEPWASAAKSAITAISFGTASWVAWTRVTDHQHYPVDVIAGALLGAGTALFFYSYQQWWGAPKEDTLHSSSIPSFELTLLRVSF